MSKYQSKYVPKAKNYGKTVIKKTHVHVKNPLFITTILLLLLVDLWSSKI